MSKFFHCWPGLGGDVRGASSPADWACGSPVEVPSARSSAPGRRLFRFLEVPTGRATVRRLRQEAPGDESPQEHRPEKGRATVHARGLLARLAPVRKGTVDRAGSQSAIARNGWGVRAIGGCSAFASRIPRDGAGNLSEEAIRLKSNALDRRGRRRSGLALPRGASSSGPRQWRFGARRAYDARSYLYNPSRRRVATAWRPRADILPILVASFGERRCSNGPGSC